MTFTLSRQGETFTADLNNPIDISLPVADFTRAWYVDPPVFEPVVLGDWVGSVEQGGGVNFRNVTFNPHAHCTHTECLGHVTKAVHSVNKIVNTHWFLAELITVVPVPINGDQVITATAIDAAWKRRDVDALVIRTSPNDPARSTVDLSNSNWPFLDEEAAANMAHVGLKHLLIDQPSVDKEEDGGKLLAHKAFWDIPKAPRNNATITELIFVPNEFEDGLYLLNLQVAPIENDAAPSRPVLFGLEG